MATLMIAANLPDIDVLGLLFGENLAWRRGWTHGPIALLILPLMLTAAMVAYDRWQQKRHTRPKNRLPVKPGAILMLAYIGIATHPLLDFLNSYGIRCLMPFSDRWFYGDVLFIIDLWVWASLGLGIWLSRRRERKLLEPSSGASFAMEQGLNQSPRTVPLIVDNQALNAPLAGTQQQQRYVSAPALYALAAVTLYCLFMAAGGRVAEHYVKREVALQAGVPPQRVLASAVPVDPFKRRLVYELGDSYGFGEFRWLPAPQIRLENARIATEMAHPAISAARQSDKAVADFLYWSRYPFARIDQLTDGVEITIGDARYSKRPDEGSFKVKAFVPDAGLVLEQPQ